MGIQVFFLRALFFFFSHARIGLLVEPGRETEKLIIVPLQWASEAHVWIYVHFESTV